jgi:hypothetical protein
VSSSPHTFRLDLKRPRMGFSLASSFFLGAILCSAQDAAAVDRAASVNSQRLSSVLKGVRVQRIGVRRDANELSA